MSYRPYDNYYVLFDTFNGSGISVNADATPLGRLVHNGVDDFGGAATVFVSNIDVGRYVASGNIPGTYNGGDSLSLTISGYMNGILQKAATSLGILERPVSVTGISSISSLVTVTGIYPGLTISVTGGYIQNVINPVSITGLISSTNLVTVTGILPGLTIGVTGANVWNASDLLQLRYKLGIDGLAATPTNQYAGKLELSLSGVHNIMVEAGINMNQWMSIVGAAIAGSSTINGNTITYYSMNNNNISRINSTAISGARNAIVLFLP